MRLPIEVELDAFMLQTLSVVRGYHHPLYLARLDVNRLVGTSLALLRQSLPSWS